LADKNQPAVARATAALELAAYIEPDNDVPQILRNLLDDRDPQVRAAAVLALQGAVTEESLETHVSALAPLLRDSTRLLRTEAARALALEILTQRGPRNGADELRGDERESFRKALDECFANLANENDRAAGHLSQAVLFEGLGDLNQAIDAYQMAMQVEPTSIGARTNLAALYERQTQEAIQRARQLEQQGNRAAARQEFERTRHLPQQFERLRMEELGLLERDVLLAPDNAPLQGRIGLARYLARWNKEADTALLAASLLEPRNPEHIFRRAIYLRDTGRAAQAAPLVQQLLKLRPDSRLFRQFAEELSSGGPAGDPRGR